MQTIPDEVLDRMVEHRPHLAQMVANLRHHAASPVATQIERGIAQAYGTSGSALTPTETWWLAQVAHGGPWGGDWVDVQTAALLTGYEESYVRRLAAEGDIVARKWGKSWYVERSSLVIKTVTADIKE